MCLLTVRCQYLLTFGFFFENNSNGVFGFPAAEIVTKTFAEQNHFFTFLYEVYKKRASSILPELKAVPDGPKLVMELSSCKNKCFL